jgi:hypothetical protein
VRKPLNESALESELASSAFFAQPRKQAVPTEAPEIAAPSEPRSPAAPPPRSRSTQPGVTTSRRHDATTAQEVGGEAQIERLRRAVKQSGNGHSTYRLTVEEKQELARIVFIYGERGIKTTFNEITRVGLNWLLEDFRARGDDSILARVLDRLND